MNRMHAGWVWVALVTLSLSSAARTLSAASLPSELAAAGALFEVRETVTTARPSTTNGFSGGTQLPDGSFENGPLASGWTESMNTSPDCTTSIAPWTAMWGGVPPHGAYSLWVGGHCPGATVNSAVVNSASQQVVVPQSSPFLIFWYLAERIDPNDGAGSDVAYVTVKPGGQSEIPIWTLDVSTSATNTWDLGTGTGCWIPVKRYLGDFAGQTVTLKVGINQIDGNGPGNVLFDDFRWGDLLFADGFECGSGFWTLGSGS